MKLLLAPKKEGVVTSFRSIKRSRQQSNSDIVGFARMIDFNDVYETIQVPERRTVTWGIDLDGLAIWLKENEGR